MSLYEKDTPRAIQLLRNYRNRLISPEDDDLRNAIDHLLLMFESNLFKALLDIQRFYEVTLLSDSKSSQQKTQETFNYMQQMEKQAALAKAPRPKPLNRPDRPVSNLSNHLQISNETVNGNRSVISPSVSATVSTTRVSSNDNASSTSEQTANSMNGSSLSQNQCPRSSLTSSISNGTPLSEQETITLRRPPAGGGFGFSIAGGTDLPHAHPMDPRIYVTRVNPDGVAARDGKMKVNDIILSVNGVSILNVSHANAVDQLKRAGDTLILEVKHTDLGPFIAKPDFPIIPPSTPINPPVVTPQPMYVPSQQPLSTRVVSPPNFQTKLLLNSTQEQPRTPPLPPPKPNKKISETDQTKTQVLTPLSPPVTKPINVTSKVAPAPLPIPRKSSASSEYTSSSVSTTSEEDSSESESDVSDHHDGSAFKKKANNIQANLPKVEVSIAKLPEEIPPSQSKVSGSSTIQIELMKGPTGGFGFSIAGGVRNEHVPGDSGIFITNVIEGGPAHRQGQMQPGDRLIAVNDKSLQNVTHPEAINALRNAGQRIRLILVQPPDDQRNYFACGQQMVGSDLSSSSATSSIESNLNVPPKPLSTVTKNGNGNVPFSPTVSGQLPNKGLPKDARTIILQKGSSSGLGFNIVSGDQDKGVFISHIYPGSIAANSGSLQVGDQLLMVNGNELSNVSHSIGVNYLKNAGDRVELVALFRPDVQARLLSNDNNQQPQPPPPPTLPQQQQSQQPFNPLSPQMRPLASSRSQPDLAISSSNLPIDKGDFAIPEGYATQPRNATAVNNQMNKKAPAASGGTSGGSGGIAKRIHGRDGAAGAGVMSPQMRGAKSQGNLADVQIQQKSSPKASRTLPEEFYVRALFDYDAKTDSGLPTKGLSFHIGDILHIVDALDDEWWRARMVYPFGGESRTSLVPSHWRRERRERARLKRVNFNQNHPMAGAVSSPNLGLSWDAGLDSPTMRRGGAGGGRGGSNANTPNMTSLGRKLIKGTNNNADSSHVIGAIAGSRSREGINELGLEKIPTYEHVERIVSEFTRPVVIMGALKDNLHDALVTDYPDRFKTCVPHTSRLPRENEVHGRDYFFTSREEMEEEIKKHSFIEAGQYNGNLYGTSITSVRDVANSGRHCILDVSGPALRRLCDAALHPISVLVYPLTNEQLKDLLSSVGKWSTEADENTLVLTMDKLSTLRNDFGALFTAILRENNTFDSLYERVKQVIQDQAENGIWVLSPKQLCFTSSQSNMDT